MPFSAPSPQPSLLSRPIRVCGIQYALRPVGGFEAFAAQVESFVDVGDDYASDILIFPELLSTQLLSCMPRSGTPAEAMRELAERYTDPFDQLFKGLAQTYNRTIVAGTHPRLVAGKLLNVASAFVPGFDPVHQPKLHLTPTERATWHFETGHELNIVEVDWGRFAMSICYDIQFPEIGRIVCEKGVELIVVPYLTDDWRGYTRVTSCARARAVENQIYVATAGMVGSLPLVTYLTAQFAQSGIYTPADYAFHHDGIASEASPNSEMVVVADLDLSVLARVRASGSVTNYEDAINDGLHVTFDGALAVVDRRRGAKAAAASPLISRS